ncbi:MAG: single-stranded DNA-binding protein [Opitutales bacterium]|nr:single-stranded DNA-binding protein [Opitutales bacterium]
MTGYLTDDIELRSFDKTNISTFRLAVNEGKETIFMPVQVWNQEHLRNFLSKGSRALVTGSLKQEQWETKKGEKRSRMVLNARNVEFLDPKEK